MEFSQIVAEVVRANFFFALIPTLTPTEARKQKYLFTGGYLHSPAVVVTRSGAGAPALPASFEGLRVAIERGHASREILRRSKPAAIFVDRDDTGEALRAVSTGEADAYIGMLAVAHYYIEQLHLINLTVRKHFDADLSAMAIAVNQNQPVLHSILRKAMMFVSDDEGNALIRRNLPAIVGGSLAPSDKVSLVALLNNDVLMPRGQMTVLSAVEQATEALVRLYDGGSEDVLELPQLIGLRQHPIEA